MKILVYAPYMPPYPGGQERFAFRLATELALLSHRVTILTSDFMYSQSSPPPSGTTLVPHKTMLRILRNPITPTMLLTSFRMRNCELIHAHNEHSFQAIVAFLLHVLIRKPLVITVHGQLRFGDSLLDKIERVYEHTIGRLILQSATAVVVLSNADKKFVERISPNSKCRISIIPPAVDVAIQPRSLSAQRIRPQLREVVGSGREIVLFVGQMVSRKGVPSLLHAFKWVEEKNPNCYLVAVGEGPELRDFIKLARDLGVRNVLFTGWANPDELAYLYRSSTLFCLPSLSEGCPLSVLEAMSHRLPVIVSKIDCLTDLFEGAALLVSPGNVCGLADAISLLLLDPQTRTRLGEKGLSLVTERYSWKKVVSDYDSLFRSLTRANEGVGL